VCAAGAWSRLIGDMVGVEIPISPIRRQIAFTERIDDLPLTLPSLTIDFPSTLYFHREGGGLALGWSDPDEPVGFNVTFELEHWLAGVAEVAAVRLPLALGCGIRTGWAGLYEVTPDNNQIIDRCAEIDGFFIAAGYSGHGFLMGPATGEIVRDLVLEREPAFDVTPFRLNRFRTADDAPSEVNIV
jgi:sarcosine oxidase subunit beta